MADTDTSLDADEQFGQHLRTFIGTTSDDAAHEVTVDGTVVRLMLEALGDRNPIYTDPAAAAKSPHGTIVAPPTMLMCWSVQARPQPWQATDAEGRTWFRLENGLARRPSDAADAAVNTTGIRKALADGGFVAPAVTNGWFEYRRYLRPGEKLRVGPVVWEDVMGPKKTSLGLGFFLTQSQTLYDEAGEEVAVVRMRMLSSRPVVSADGAQSAPARAAPKVEYAPDALWGPAEPKWAPSLTEVGVGDKLPELIIELTPTQIIQGAIASQDWAPVHHDRDIAQKMGHPDIFMNIQSSTGLVGRLITDWAGSDALIEKLDLRLGISAYAYDRLTMTGEVTAVEPAEGGRARVTVGVVAQCSLGAHIISNATFTVPAKIRG